LKYFFSVASGKMKWMSCEQNPPQVAQNHLHFKTSFLFENCVHFKNQNLHQNPKCTDRKQKGLQATKPQKRRNVPFVLRRNGHRKESCHHLGCNTKSMSRQRSDRNNRAHRFISGKNVENSPDLQDDRG
jgi:hypothetical protein